MRKEEAKEIIVSTFSNDFDAQRYKKFVSNLFKKYSPADKVVEGSYIKQAFAPFVVKYKITGTFEDSEGNKIDILEVNLSKTSTLERARTAQRNFVAEYLKSRNKDAAIVAFVSPDNKEWRLSLVKLEHSLEVVEERLRTTEEITPAKRWSFLVGKHEGSHTAQSRFINLLVSDEDPNLAELESAFDIETVTKEFFNKYTELFFQLKEHLDLLTEKDEKIKKDFEEKEISTVDFAKKTLGQIVFLYFLQKKGWFGVAPDQEWGEGPKKFLRELFKKRAQYGDNFFNDILEPLFYKALAQDRGKESIYSDLNNCRMPFLNGGLFEPMNGYMWETTDIVIPDDIFSNGIEDKKTDDIGNGIFDVFDRYNFTVNENEPLEKEVAVDPEMLGKIFENLLDIKDRKSKGAFYTPREIVHYMCQESLINCLESETKNEIPRADIELFIQKGDRIIENDKITLARKKERDEKYGSDKYKDSTYSLLLPESIRIKAGYLDELLKNIKVADPAVGSGAFPLGMINEIVRARKVLNVYIKRDVSDYELKKHTITNSIYGVDIDPGAVDIAKLRLWLALVVDEETPHPLPNLEHKIMQGNSLISEYEGIKLFDDSFFEDSQQQEKEKVQINGKLSLLQREYFKLHADDELTPVKKTEIEREIKSLQIRLKNTNNRKEAPSTNTGLFDIPDKQKEAQKKTMLLQKKVEEFVNESQKTKKQNLKEEIDNLKWELIEETLTEQGKEGKLEEIKKLRKKNICPFFIWKLEFSDVFKKKGGFDVVIGNPPYVSYGLRGVGKMDSGYKEYLKTHFSNSAEYKLSLYAIFMELAIHLNAPSGNSTYIVPDSFLLGRYFSKIRRYVMDKCKIINLMLIKAKVFENATVGQSVVYLFQKSEDKNENINIILTKDKKEIEAHSFLKNQYSQKYFDSIEFNRFRMLFDKKIYNLINKIDKKSVELNKFYRGHTGVRSKIGQKNIVSKKKEKETYKKSIISGGQISNYFIKFEDDYINIDPKILHGGGFNKKIIEKEKLLLRQTSDKIICGIDRLGLYHLNNVHSFAPINNKCDIRYIAAILNSRLLDFYYKKISLEEGRAMAQIDIEVAEKLPIPEISLLEQKIFIYLVDQILDITSTPGYDPKNPPVKQKELERQIDELVYKLYDLMEEEIEIVENSSKK